MNTITAAQAVNEVVPLTAAQWDAIRAHMAAIQERDRIRCEEIAREIVAAKALIFVRGKHVKHAPNVIAAQAATIERLTRELAALRAA